MYRLKRTRILERASSAGDINVKTGNHHPETVVVVPVVRVVVVPVRGTDVVVVVVPRAAAQHAGASPDEPAVTGKSTFYFYQKT